MTTVNDVVCFLLEVAALAAAAVVGWSVTDGPARWVAMIVLPGLAAAIWGRWMAPRSANRLVDPNRFVAEAVFFVAAFGALAVTGHPLAGGVLLVVAAVNRPLDRYLARRVPRR